MAGKGKANPAGTVATLRLNDEGPDVSALQQRLAASGFSPGTIDGKFGNGTEAAVLAFQRSEGLLADGVVGPQTRAKLFGGEVAAPVDVTGVIGPSLVSKMFPFTPIGNIKRNLPFVLDAMTQARLNDRVMVLMALATIRAETESFEPVAEGRSRFNTSPNGHPFDLYDNRKDLGNRGKPDGFDFRGRGFVQLTGRFNYENFGNRIHQPLGTNPDLAGEPAIAATLLALFLGDKERPIK